MFFSSHAVQVKKLANQTTDTDKEDYQANISFWCNIQPSSDTTVVLFEGAFGKTYTCYAPTSASVVEIGDKFVTLSGVGVGDEYVVRGLKDWNQNVLPHYEFVLFKVNPLGDE